MDQHRTQKRSYSVMNIIPMLGYRGSIEQPTYLESWANVGPKYLLLDCSGSLTVAPSFGSLISWLHGTYHVCPRHGLRSDPLKLKCDGIRQKRELY